MGVLLSAQPVAVPQPTPITLGQPDLPLNGPWKFHVGDNPQWADPNFDDANWQQYVVSSEHPALTLEQALQTDPVPGWQQHGYPGYTGYAWYRIRIGVPQNSGSIALLMPPHVDDAYEVYVNGTKIGNFGELSGWRRVYTSQTELFPIPDALLDKDQPIVLALRFWSLRTEASPSEHNLDGGLRGVPLIGQHALLQIFERSVRQQTWRVPWNLLIDLSLYGSVGLTSLFLFLLSRGQREYLWAGVSLAGFSVMVGCIAILNSPQTIISLQGAFIAEELAYLAAAFAMPLAAMYLLNVPRTIWRRANYSIFVFALVWCLADAGVLVGLLPPTSGWTYLSKISDLLAIFGLAGLLLAIAIDGVRSIGKKAWLPMTPGVLIALYIILYSLFEYGLYPRRFFVFAAMIAGSVPVSVLIVFLIRFTQQQRENVRLADDMRQAQEVQHVMVPQARVALPGLTIETEYRPAREVGGDFFQIVEHPTDGSVLIVAGDVVGKGLKAGMLVALLVGAIRSTVELNPNPGFLMQALNRRLLGRGDSQATCLALRIARDGTVALANAGHIAPYLNGEPLPMEGALPLGMIEAAEPSILHFQFKHGDTLMLMSDGIAEATDADGNLFGFERVRDLVLSNKSAAEMASEAQSFGQEDDISVIAVTRTLVTEPVPA